MVDSDHTGASSWCGVGMLCEQGPADRTLGALWGPSVKAQPDVPAHSTLSLHMHISM